MVVTTDHLSGGGFVTDPRRTPVRGVLGVHVGPTVWVTGVSKRRTPGVDRGPRVRKERSTAIRRVGVTGVATTLPTVCRDWNTISVLS